MFSTKSLLLLSASGWRGSVLASKPSCVNGDHKCKKSETTPNAYWKTTRSGAHKNQPQRTIIDVWQFASGLLSVVVVTHWLAVVVASPVLFGLPVSGAIDPYLSSLHHDTLTRPGNAHCLPPLAHQLIIFLFFVLAVGKWIEFFCWSGESFDTFCLSRLFVDL